MATIGRTIRNSSHSQLSGIARAICAGFDKARDRDLCLRTIEYAATRTQSPHLLVRRRRAARRPAAAVDRRQRHRFQQARRLTILHDAAESALRGSPRAILAGDPTWRRCDTTMARSKGDPERRSAPRRSLRLSTDGSTSAAHPVGGEAGMEVVPTLKFYGSCAASVERFAENELTPMRGRRPSWLVTATARRHAGTASPRAERGDGRCSRRDGLSVPEGRPGPLAGPRRPLRRGVLDRGEAARHAESTAA